MCWIAVAFGLVSMAVAGYMVVLNHRRSRLFDQLVAEYEDLDRAHAALKAHVKSLGTTVFVGEGLN
jgi:cell division protein FtsB